MRISASTSDFLTLPSVLRITPELVRTTVHPMALTSDFRAAFQAASPSLMHSALLRLFSDLRHVSYAVSELRIRATILGITPMDSASIPDHYGLHGIATPPSPFAIPSDFRRSSAGATHATPDFAPSRFTLEYPSGPPGISMRPPTVI
jgi:hypothetical protein